MRGAPRTTGRVRAARRRRAPRGRGGEGRPQRCPRDRPARMPGGPRGGAGPQRGPWLRPSARPDRPGSARARRAARCAGRRGTPPARRDWSPL